MLKTPEPAIWSQSTLEGAPNMCSAMRRLPSEILSEIFLHTVDKRDGCRPPLVARICRRWRGVALSTARLWSNIYLDELDLPLSSLHPLLSLQLERSRGAPLSVVFSDSSDDTSVLELLLTAAHRWQYLDINLATGQYELINTCGSHFPMLKRLAIRITPSFELGNLSRPLPLLEELTLSWPPWPIPSPIPWTNLSRCTLFHCSSSEVFDILRCSPRMAHLVLHFCYGVHAEREKPIVNSSLRSLKISRCTRSFNQYLSAQLSAPRLQELLIDDFDDGNSTTSTPLLPFFPSSSTSLTHLTLCGVTLSEDELLTLLQHTPALTHLVVSWPSDVHSTALMTALTLLPGKRPTFTRNLVPRLRALSITGGLSCTDRSLYMMLRSRLGRLQHVQLYYAGRAVFFDRALDALREEGMDIVLLFDGPDDPYRDWQSGEEDANEMG